MELARETHPDIPIVLCSSIISPPREDMKNAVGFTLKEMREEVRAAHESLVACGDSNLFYVDGKKLMGEDEVRYMPDGVHPDAEGCRKLAENFEREVFSAISL